MPFDAGNPSPRMLTAALTRSANARQLVRLCETYGERFNAVHLSAFWSTLGKHSRRNPDDCRWLSSRACPTALLHGVS